MQANEDMNLKKILGILLDHRIGNISRNILYKESLRFPWSQILMVSEVCRVYTQMNQFFAKSLMAHSIYSSDQENFSPFLKENI